MSLSFSDGVLFNLWIKSIMERTASITAIHFGKKSGGMVFETKNLGLGTSNGMITKYRIC